MLSLCFESAGPPERCGAQRRSGVPSFPLGHVRDLRGGVRLTPPAAPDSSQTPLRSSNGLRDYEVRGAELINYPFTYVRSSRLRRIN